MAIILIVIFVLIILGIFLVMGVTEDRDKINMKTKYILSGGYAGHVNEENDKFFKEILDIEKKRLQILFVHFAKEGSERERQREEDLYQFSHLKGDKELTFKNATEKDFVKQVKSADIVYFRGGQTLKLLEILQRFDNLRASFAGKIVAGESAGAYVLSTYFYSKTEGGLFKGLGLVPVKTICHYIGENAEKLDECPKGLETLLLPDYKYKVFKV